MQPGAKDSLVGSVVELVDTRREAGRDMAYRGRFGLLSKTTPFCRGSFRGFNGDGPLSCRFKSCRSHGTIFYTEATMRRGIIYRSRMARASRIWKRARLYERCVIDPEGVNLNVCYKKAKRLTKRACRIEKRARNGRCPI